MKAIICCTQFTEEIASSEVIFEQEYEVPDTRTTQGEVMSPGIYIMEDSYYEGRYIKLHYCPFCGTKIEFE